MSIAIRLRFFFYHLFPSDNYESKKSIPKQQPYFENEIQSVKLSVKNSTATIVK